MAKDDKGMEAHQVEVVGVRPAVIQAGGREYELEALEPEEVMARVERWNKVLDQVTLFALRQTRPQHWCAIGERGKTRPWLTGPGAENMIKRCGLRVEYCDPPYTIESGRDADGPFVKYTCRLRVSLARWTSIVAEGHCTSRDAFFSRGGKLSHAQVDKGNLQQSAYTNALVNGVCRLLGIRNMTWGELEEITGGNVSVDKVQHAEFRRGKKGGVSRGSKERQAQPEQRARVWTEWCDAHGIDQKSPPDGTGPRFYEWVESVLGKEKRQRERWTEADAKKLVDAARQIQADGVADAPDAGDGDGGDGAASTEG